MEGGRHAAVVQLVHAAANYREAKALSEYKTRPPVVGTRDALLRAGRAYLRQRGTAAPPWEAVMDLLATCGFERHEFDAARRGAKTPGKRAVSPTKL